MNYEDIREKMKPGDIIAFGGSGAVSTIIKLKTKSPVSHVGIIFQSQVPTMDGFLNQIIESTSLGDGFAGVQVNFMSMHIKSYRGNIWWLPIKEEVRPYLNLNDFMTFCREQEGKPYDAPQAIMSAIDFVPDSRENFDKLFCSELDAAALEAGFEKAFSGDLPDDIFEMIEELKDINASEQTPADVCRFKLYGEPVQIKGTKIVLNTD